MPNAPSITWTNPVILTGPFPDEESRRGVYTGEVVGDLPWPQHPLDTVGPQFVPLSAVGVAQAEAHLLLLSVHRGGFLQSVFIVKTDQHIQYRHGVSKTSGIYVHVY